jgi:hypothetical protein
MKEKECKKSSSQKFAISRKNVTMRIYSKNIKSNHKQVTNLNLSSFEEKLKAAKGSLKRLETMASSSPLVQKSIPEHDPIYEQYMAMASRVDKSMEQVTVQTLEDVDQSLHEMVKALKDKKAGESIQEILVVEGNDVKTYYTVSAEVVEEKGKKTIQTEIKIYDKTKVDLDKTDVDTEPISLEFDPDADIKDIRKELNKENLGAWQAEIEEAILPKIMQLERKVGERLQEEVNDCGDGFENPLFEEEEFEEATVANQARREEPEMIFRGAGGVKDQAEHTIHKANEMRKHWGAASLSEKQEIFEEIKKLQDIFSNIDSIKTEQGDLAQIFQLIKPLNDLIRDIGERVEVDTEAAAQAAAYHAARETAAAKQLAAELERSQHSYAGLKGPAEDAIHKAHFLDLGRNPSDEKISEAKALLEKLENLAENLLHVNVFPFKTEAEQLAFQVKVEIDILQHDINQAQKT